MRCVPVFLFECGIDVVDPTLVVESSRTSHGDYTSSVVRHLSKRSEESQRFNKKKTKAKSYAPKSIAICLCNLRHLPDEMLDRAWHGFQAFLGILGLLIIASATSKVAVIEAEHARLAANLTGTALPPMAPPLAALTPPTPPQGSGQNGGAAAPDEHWQRLRGQLILAASLLLVAALSAHRGRSVLQHRLEAFAKAGIPDYMRTSKSPKD